MVTTLAIDPTTRRWWALTDAMQDALPDREREPGGRHPPKSSTPGRSPGLATNCGSMDGALASCDVVGGTPPHQLMAAVAGARARADAAIAQ